MTGPTTAAPATRLLAIEDLPRPSDGALRVLAACADEDADLAGVARLVAADPALTADLLKVVNSPYFGLGQNVASIDHAVAVLGLDALRNRIICLTVRRALRAVDMPNLDGPIFMADSLRRAVAARALAPRAGTDPDEAFAAGLLQDFGLLVLLFLHPEVEHGQWQQLRATQPAARLGLEQALFGARHDRTLAQLAEAWNLPRSLIEAVRDHHEEAPAGALARVLGAADAINAVYATALEPNADAAGLARARLVKEFGMSAASAHEWLAEIPALVQQAAEGLGMPIPEQRDLESLSASLNARLAKDNLDFQEMNWRLQQALRERDELASRLAQELEIAREIQCSLLPPPSCSGGPFWARNVSASELSGDFYDCYTAGEGRLLFNLGDVSGKGLTAALLMAKTCSLFRCLGRRHASLEDVMGIINEELCETSVRGMFVTMVAGVYEAVTGQVEIVSAGHPPPMLWRAGQGLAVVAAADTPPLGVVPGLRFTGARLCLSRASLYLYSDGLSEALDERGQALGLAGLARHIARASDLPPPSRIDAILQAVAGAAGARQDDITLAVLDAAAAA